MKVLITGGVRSGKSFHAESLLLAEPKVTYIAPGPPADPVSDPEWAARVARHQSRRPSYWTTVETSDLGEAVRAAEGAVLIDCLGTWVAWVSGGVDGWGAGLEDWGAGRFGRVAEAGAAIG